MTTDLFTTPRQTSTDKRKAMLERRNRKPVTYPLFEEAATFSTDRYWIEHLQQAARARFPRGIFPREGKLVYLHKNVEKYLPLPDTAKQLAQDYIAFLQNNLGLRSDKDLEYARINAELLASAERPEVTWNKISKRNKAWMLEQYAARLAVSLSLSKVCQEQLTQLLLAGFYIGVFNSATVHYANGRVTEVEGVIYRAKRGIFEIDAELLRKAVAKAEKKLQEMPEKSLLVDKHPAFRPRKCSVVKQLAEYLAKCETTKKSGGAEKRGRKSATSTTTAQDEDIPEEFVLEDDE
jgi:hypothetical protein